MHRTMAGSLPSHTGEQVRIEGWIHRRRQHADITFVVVRDRSGLVQIVVRDEGVRTHLHELGEETVIAAEGTVVSNPKAPGGAELIDPTVTVLSGAAKPVPIELWRPTLNLSLPVQLDTAPISWRHPSQRAVWQVAARSMQGFRATLDNDGFTEIQTPKLVGSSTESGANVFSLDYFGRPAYLAQSPQFYKQTMVGVFERVYEVGPVFRAEPHETARHLAEYVSLDVELGFIDTHRDVVAVLRDVVAGMVESIAADPAAAGVAALPDVPRELPMIHFADALRRVEAPVDEPDLAPEHERALCAWALEEYGSEFLIVEGYPARKRPFYTHPQPDDPRWTNSFDLLFRGLELVTGGQRRHRYQDYVDALTERGESIAAYESYLQPFRYGMPPHGGFAIGLERWVARLVGADNVRRTTLFPRDRQRLTP